MKLSENIKSSIFEFIYNTPKVNWSHMKYCVVNNNYPLQGDHNRRLTVMTNILLLSESQNNVSAKTIRFFMSLVVTGYEIVSKSNAFTMTIIILPSSSTLCTLEVFHWICVHKRPFHDIVSDSDGVTTTIKISPSSLTFFTLESSVDFVLIEDDYIIDIFVK